MLAIHYNLCQHTYVFKFNQQNFFEKKLSKTVSSHEKRFGELMQLAEYIK